MFDYLDHVLLDDLFEYHFALTPTLNLFYSNLILKSINL